LFRYSVCRFLRPDGISRPREANAADICKSRVEAKARAESVFARAGAKFPNSASRNAEFISHPAAPFFHFERYCIAFLEGDSGEMNRQFAWAAGKSEEDFKGWGVVHRSDEVFQPGCQMYRDMGLTLEVRAVVLIRIERALPVISPAYDRGDTEEQVKDRWRQYWRKLWEGVEE
jgi:hypothetical protein